MAKSWANHVLSEFSDASGLFKYSATEELISKIIRTSDGVLPSANAIMAKVLLELGHIDFNTAYMEKSKNMMAKMNGLFSERPQDYGQWGSIFLNHAYPYFEIVTVGKAAQERVAELGAYFIPNAIIVGSKQENPLALFKGRYVPGETYIYVCKDQTCKLPVKRTVDALGQLKDFGFEIPASEHGIFPL